jgi:hypothetical protein
MRGVFDVAGLMEDQDGLHLVGKNGKVVYLSFIQRVSQVNDVYYGFELHRGDGNANRVLSIGHGAEGTGYGVASNFNTLWRQLGESPLFASLGEEDTLAHLIVVRIEFGAGNRDVATIYRDPESLIDEERCTATATLKGNLAFDRISLANFDSLRGQVHEVDEIRVGTSFTAVTGQRSGKELPLTDALTSKTASLQRTTNQSDFFCSRQAIVGTGGPPVGELRGNATGEPPVTTLQLATISQWPCVALECSGQGTSLL